MIRVADIVHKGRAASFRTPLRPEQIAWAVILLAFGVFCLICLVSGIGINYFLFKSTVPMTTSLVVGRGTVGMTGTDLIEQVVRDSRGIFPSAMITTDGQSQAILSFFDPYYERQLVSTVTVKSNTELNANTGARPRFEWATVDYTINITSFRGAVDVLVPDNLLRPIRLTLQTNTGAQVLITRSGRYTIRATPEVVQVDNTTGEALIITRDGRSQTIPSGQRGVLNLFDQQTIVMPSFTDLLENSTFQRTNVAATSSGNDLRVLPLAWACTDQPNDMPRGQYGVARVDGRTALRLTRGEGARSHGETYCEQNFGPPDTPGRDVSSYSFLSARATFRISHQSLSGCGVVGSECPFMLRMDYIDVNGQPQQWYHGFYTVTNPSLGWPLSCASCTQEHDPVNANTWYTYESDNLYALIPTSRRPRSIQRVRIYASGHEYDVYVSEVSLLAGQVEIVDAETALNR